MEMHCELNGCGKVFAYFLVSTMEKLRLRISRRILRLFRNRNQENTRHTLANWIKGVSVENLTTKSIISDAKNLQYE